MDEIWYKWKFGAMPIDSQNFRTVCGCFLPTFLSFMCRRAREAKLRRVRVLKCRTVTLNVLCFFLTFVIAAVMQQAGDVETNPGPNGEGNDENGTTLVGFLLGTDADDYIGDWTTPFVAGFAPAVTNWLTGEPKDNSHLTIYKREATTVIPVPAAGWLLLGGLGGLAAMRRRKRA